MGIGAERLNPSYRNSAKIAELLLRDPSTRAPTLALIVTHKFCLHTAEVEHTTDSGQPLKTWQVLGYPSLEKRGQGRFFALTWLHRPRGQPIC